MNDTGPSESMTRGGEMSFLEHLDELRNRIIVCIAAFGVALGFCFWKSDLLLEIEYAAHPQFEVDGRNIIHVLPVAPWEAALGATVSVPTLGGPVDLKIPADSEAGRKLRLRGRGLPGTPTGDQIVELEVLAPKAHTGAEREAYERLRDAFGDDWRRA